MKVIIDPYRGGKDTGNFFNGQYEKNILLNLSKTLQMELEKLGINSELVRETDVSLTDDERNSIINELKNQNDIIIQNRISDDNEFNIVYPLRNSDNLPSLIAKNLQSSGIRIDNYYQRRLPSNTMLDYYSVIRNTTPNETIIIDFLNGNNAETIKIIARTIKEYINKKNTYTVKSGDSLYQIAKKYNTTVDELKKINNLSSNSLKIGQILKIPSSKEIFETENKENIYIVKSGDSLYQIAKKYNTTVDELKKINNLSSNNLNIGQKLILPNKNVEESNQYTTYTVQKGDSLYQISKKYNTTVDELKKINNLNSNSLSIGQKLKVPTINEDYLNYIVQKGDSLYQIAKKYNVTINEIKSLNGLTTNNLSIGQNLKIPR